MQRKMPHTRTYNQNLLGNTFQLALVLDNLCEVFGCSIITDFMSKMFGFSIAFSC